MRRRAALSAQLAAGLAGGALAAAAAGGDPHAAGAYCPLPPPGQKPHCLEPAKAAYGEFFTALESGTPAESDAARLEGDVAAGAGSEQAYVALSSLAYGYWLLSERAESEHADPVVVQRLERWNALLRQAYAASPADARYRAALREAALDLHRRAPPVRVRCVAADGATAECDSTEVVLRGIDATAGEVGLRGALSRLLARLIGSDAP
jgi:hypothetical protein